MDSTTNHYLEKLNGLLSFNYSCQEINFSYNEDDFGYTALHIVSKDSVLGTVNMDSSLIKLGNDLIVILTDDEPGGSEEVSYDGPSIYNVFVPIQKTLQSLFLELIREVHQSFSQAVSYGILEALLKKIKHFEVVVLEEQDHYLLQAHSSMWGLNIDEFTRETMASHYTVGDEPMKPLTEVEIFHNTKNILIDLFPVVKERLERLLMVLDKNSEYVSMNNHNGLFFSYGPKQVISIENMLQNAGDELVPKEELRSWIEFLSGQTLPSKPLNWTGPLTHFSFLLRKSKSLSDDSNSVTKLPLSLVKSQVDWDAIGQYVQYKGKRVTHKMTTNSVDPKKNTRIKYITDFYELYQGE
jgi:hypothetical protein